MAAPKNPTAGPFYVFFGGEGFFLDREIERTKRWTGRTVITLEGDGLTDHEVVSICETEGFDGALRVVLLDEANKVKGDKALKKYIEERVATDTRTVLVAIVRSEKCPALWAHAAKKGRLVEHKKLKTWDSNNEVVKWIDAEARRLELNLDKGLADALFFAVGGDLYRISSELSKLVLLVGTGKGTLATMTHLKSIVSPSPTAEPFQVVEAAMEKDARKAMNLLSTLYKNQGEDANVPLTYALMRQVEKLVVARALLDKGTSEEEMAAALGMHPYRFKSFYLPQIRRHTMVDLIHHMGRLCQLDADVKSGARSKRTLVELAVLSVAG